MYLRWCVALLSAVSFSFSQDSTGIDSPGALVHNSKSTSLKADSTKSTGLKADSTKSTGLKADSTKSTGLKADSTKSTGLKADSTKAKTDSNMVNTSKNSSNLTLNSAKPNTISSVSNENNPSDKCGLQISCFPDSASVFINSYKGSLTPPHLTLSMNNSKAGLTPFKKWGFQEGNYEITIEKDGWEEYKQIVYLKKGQMTSLECHLTCLSGYLQVKSEPQGATVFINKNKEGITPLTLTDLKPGFYSLRLELAKFAPAEMIVSVVKDSKTTVNRTLLTQKAIDSLHVIRQKRGQNLRRCLFAVASIACASAGYYFNHKVDQLLDNEKADYDYYNSLKSGTSEATFNDVWIKYAYDIRQTNAEKKKRNMFYEASAILAAGFIISIPF